MPDTLQVKDSTIRLQITDITDLEIEAFVFYASHDLKLGSGFGTAVSIRGGPSVQEELDPLAPVATTEVVVTAAGKLKAEHILHAVGPRFQEEDLEAKLRTTVQNCLRLADEKGIKQIALPAMGAGFFGVPLPVSAAVVLGTTCDYLAGKTGITDVAVCLLDNREYRVFKKEFTSLAGRLVAS